MLSILHKTQIWQLWWRVLAKAHLQTKIWPISSRWMKVALWRCMRGQDEPLLEGRELPRARWRCLCHSQNRRRRSGELSLTNVVADEPVVHYKTDKMEISVLDIWDMRKLWITRIFSTRQYFGISRNCLGGPDILNILRLQGISLKMYGGRLW